MNYRKTFFAVAFVLFGVKAHAQLWASDGNLPPIGYSLKEREAQTRAWLIGDAGPPLPAASLNWAPLDRRLTQVAGAARASEAALKAAKTVEADECCVQNFGWLRERRDQLLHTAELARAFLHRESTQRAIDDAETELGFLITQELPSEARALARGAKRPTGRRSSWHDVSSIDPVTDRDLAAYRLEHLPNACQRDSDCSFTWCWCGPVAFDTKQELEAERLARACEHLCPLSMGTLEVSRCTRGRCVIEPYRPAPTLAACFEQARRAGEKPPRKVVMTVHVGPWPRVAAEVQAPVKERSVLGQCLSRAIDFEWIDWEGPPTRTIEVGPGTPPQRSAPSPTSGDLRSVGGSEKYVPTTRESPRAAAGGR
jgi:hypothetical protein